MTFLEQTFPDEPLLMDLDLDLDLGYSTITKDNQVHQFDQAKKSRDFRWVGGMQRSRICRLFFVHWVKSRSGQKISK